MNKMLREWLHQAAIAAAAFSGQPHWSEPAELRPAARVKKPIENKPLSGFGPVFSPAD